jgi:hypothetical protein
VLSLAVHLAHFQLRIEVIKNPDHIHLQLLRREAPPINPHVLVNLPSGVTFSSVGEETTRNAAFMADLAQTVGVAAVLAPDY